MESRARKDPAGPAGALPCWTPFPGRQREGGCRRRGDRCRDPARGILGNVVRPGPEGSPSPGIQGGPSRVSQRPPRCWAVGLPREGSGARAALRGGGGAGPALKRPQSGPGGAPGLGLGERGRSRDLAKRPRGPCLGTPGARARRPEVAVPSRSALSFKKRSVTFQGQVSL